MRRRLPARAVSLVARAADRVAEARYGVATGEHVPLEELGVRSEERVSHDPSSWMAAAAALSELRVTPDDVFADLGSGLGRVLVVARRLPFRRVIGVEMSADLTERARENLERSRGPRRAGTVELVTTDVLDWEIPPDLTVAYMYSPFTGTVFERFLDRLLDSVERHPRPLRLLYNYPVEHRTLVRTGRVRPISVASSRWPWPAGAVDRIITYVVLPRDEALAREYAERYPARLEGEEHWRGDYEPGYVLEDAPLGPAESAPSSG